MTRKRARAAGTRIAPRADCSTDFTAALDLNPTDAWALGARGQAHQQADHYDQAITDFTAALDIDPTDAWAGCVNLTANLGC
ncbi:tetratricopeptide repeat protein [Streptomyces sp. NPDC057565]|uniref:tetratricopeptide repeat protein n=1 Tax=Streptomyces sp. NPDC057565 TaxID=3346169 RepID=UPI0036890DB6